MSRDLFFRSSSSHGLSRTCRTTRAASRGSMTAGDQRDRPCAQVGRAVGRCTTATEAIRRAIQHTLLPLDDCLYALQATIPHLTRSSLHRCLQRHGISRLPEVDGDEPDRRKFKSYPIGYFHIDIAEVRTEQGKLHLFVAIDRTSKFAFVQLVVKASRVTASAFLVA